MPARPWTPINAGDLLVDTQHLALDQFGAYMKLIFHAWHHDGYIPLELPAIARILGVHTNRAKTLWGFVGGFWYKTEGGYRQKRIDKELAHAIDIQEKRRSAAKKRWDANAYANGYAHTTTEEIQKDSSPSLFPEDSSSEKGEESSPSEPAEAPATDGPKIPPCPHQKLVDLWHEKCPSLARVRKVDAEKLAPNVRARWREIILGKDRENGVSGRRAPELAMMFFGHAFERVNDSAFLCGDNDREWKASYPWVMQRSKFYKLIGGDYD